MVSPVIRHNADIQTENPLISPVQISRASTIDKIQKVSVCICKKFNLLLRRLGKAQERIREMGNPKKFSKEVADQLGYYVYRLIDPRTGQTFYIGKGKADRVFQHLTRKLDFSSEQDVDNISEKYKTILEIYNAELEPVVIIHRHGLEENEALHVEASLIDMTAGLTNIVKGHGTNDFGASHVTEIIKKYSLEEFEIDDAHKLILININKSGDSDEYYKSVRSAWRISKERALTAHYVLAMLKGVCKAVFKPVEWLPGTQKNFPELIEDMSDRFGFKGVDAPNEVQKRYMNKRIPRALVSSKGASNPVRYINC